MIKKIFFFGLLLLTASCSFFSKKEPEKAIAQVGKNSLYMSDLRGMFKVGITREDSMQLLSSMVEKWVRRQLILQIAELNLSEEEMNFEKELEEYRTSLITYNYEQKYVSEKLNTEVELTEIEKYYNQNISSFILETDMVKALYIKLPKSAKGANRIAELVKSKSIENNAEIESYCYQYAIKYDYFNDEWISLNSIKSELPLNSHIPIGTIDNNSFFQFSDSAAMYLLRINEMKPKGSAAPLKSVISNIKEIILLKRKQTLINDLENNIYFDALKKNKINLNN